MPKTTKEWLSEKLYDYSNDKKGTIKEMLEDTTEIIDSFINCPHSKVAEGLLKSCLIHNKLFIKEINEVDVKKPCTACSGSSFYCGNPCGACEGTGLD